MTKGRPRKPTALLKRNGNYRKDRHGDRIDELFVGQPHKPKGLTKRQEEFWDFVISSIPDQVLSEADAVSLQAMTRWLMVWDKEMKRIEMGRAKNVHAASNAWKQAYALMQQFGMTPASRAKLRGDPKQSDESDPLTRMILEREG